MGEKLTEAQAKALTWMRDNEYHYAGWHDDWSRITLRGDRQITIKEADWFALKPFIGGYDETRKRIFPVNDAGLAALSEKGRE